MDRTASHRPPPRWSCQPLVGPGSSGVEQGIENPRVGGSNPPPGTTQAGDVGFAGIKRDFVGFVAQFRASIAPFSIVVIR